MVHLELPVIIISYLWWHLRCLSPTGPSYHPTSSLMPCPCSHLVSTFASPVLLSGVWEFVYFCMPCWSVRKCLAIQEPFSPYSHCSSEHHQQDAGPVCVQFPQINLGLCSHISKRLDMDKDWVPFLFPKEYPHKSVHMQPTIPWCFPTHEILFSSGWTWPLVLCYSNSPTCSSCPEVLLFPELSRISEPKAKIWLLLLCLFYDLCSLRKYT